MISLVNLRNMKQERDLQLANGLFRDVLSPGHVDHLIQQDILVNENQNMNLEKVFTFVEAKEASLVVMGTIIVKPKLQAINLATPTNHQLAVIAAKKIMKRIQQSCIDVEPAPSTENHAANALLKAALRVPSNSHYIGN